MAAVEILSFPEDVEFDVRPPLRLVLPDSTPLRHGPSLAKRRARRQFVLRRRRRVGAAILLASALTVLALPGHVFGATTGAGLSGDLAGSSTLASGMSYVVQNGDTVSSIARAMNPVDPAEARALLVHELHSSVVVPGEHVLIP